MFKLKKNDEIIVTAGKDKGKKGKIERVFPKNERVLILGINIFKRHVKKRDEKNPGVIFDVARPLPSANVSLICPKCNKPTRVGFELQKDKKIRICRKCKAKI